MPLSAAAVLWGLDEFESEETAQRFARLYLLKLDLGRGSMRLHNVLHRISVPLPANCVLLWSIISTFRPMIQGNFSACHRKNFTVGA
jgi:hypothetical protein